MGDETDNNTILSRIEKDVKLYAPVDINQIQAENLIDTRAFKKSLIALNNYKSMQELIAAEASKEFPAKKLIYKYKETGSASSSNNSSNNVDNISEISSHFKKISLIALKIKRQVYLGRPAIALYLTNYSNKLRQKLHTLEKRDIK